MKAILLLLTVALTGCSYTRSIGVVGNTRFIKVQLGSITAPGQTLLIMQNTNTGKITYMSPMAGNGVIPAALQAGGFAGGLIGLGHTLNRDGDDGDTRVNTTVNNHNEITDDPPSPPVTPPPVQPPVDNQTHPRGRHKGWD